MILCTDTFQQTATLALHTPNDGSNIGGNQPTNYGYNPASTNPNAPTGIDVYVGGGPFATVMMYTERPLLYAAPVGPNLQVDFDLFVGPSVSNLQLIQTDSIIVTPDEFWYNGSLQLNLDEGGQFQIVDVNGLWVDVPFAAPGIPSVGKHHYTVKYTWDDTAHTISVVSIAFDSFVYKVPANLQNVPVQTKVWAPGVSYQLQITLNGAVPAAPSVTTASVTVDNLTNTFRG
jgi:hypothetical protein